LYSENPEVIKVLRVIFLGTAGSLPTAKRGSPAIAVLHGPELILMDCGEGTQRQMAFAKLGLRSRMRILITHLHGDHILGLPGLIQTMSLFNRSSSLPIYGPKGLYAFICAIKETVNFNLTFSVEVVEVGSGLVYEEEDYYVKAAWVKHPVPTLAYAIVEKQRMGSFDPNKAEALGVPKGPLWKSLQRGFSVVTPAGSVVYPESVLGPPRRGRKLVYSSDTSPCEAVTELALNADLLIHEATFGDELSEKALEAGHSTPSMAAEAAKKAGVARLILTHISGRYNEDESFLEGAKRIFPEVMVAEDLMSLDLPLQE
jgi:ribonuclease Z